MSGPTASGKKPVLGIEARQRLAIALLQLGLVIPRVHVARPAVHEKPDDGLGLGGKMRTLGRERVERACGKTGARQHGLQGQPAKAGAGGWKKWRRVSMGEELSASVLIRKFVQRQQRLQNP